MLSSPHSIFAASMIRGRLAIKAPGESSGAPPTQNSSGLYTLWHAQQQPQ